MERKRHSKVRRTSISQTLLLVSILVSSLVGVSKTMNDKIEPSLAELHEQQQQQSPKRNLSDSIEKHGQKVLNTMRDILGGLDRQTIEKAQQQVEKFVKRIEKLLNPTKLSSRDEKRGRFISRSSRMSFRDDLVDFKDMLQRISCSVGHMKVLDSSEEAIAELDAAKVVSNIFSSPPPLSPSSLWG